MGVMNDIKVMAQQNHDLKKQARADKKAIKSLEAKVDNMTILMARRKKARDEARAKVKELEAEQNKKLIKELDWVHDELLDYCDTAAECRDQLVNYTQKLITQGEVNDD